MIPGAGHNDLFAVAGASYRRHLLSVYTRVRYSRAKRLCRRNASRYLSPTAAVISGRARARRFFLSLLLPSRKTLAILFGQFAGFRCLCFGLWRRTCERSDLTGRGANGLRSGDKHIVFGFRTSGGLLRRMGSYSSFHHYTDFAFRLAAHSPRSTGALKSDARSRSTGRRQLWEQCTVGSDRRSTLRCIGRDGEPMPW